MGLASFGHSLDLFVSQLIFNSIQYLFLRKKHVKRLKVYTADKKRKPKISKNSNIAPNTVCAVDMEVSKFKKRTLHTRVNLRYLLKAFLEILIICLD